MCTLLFLQDLLGPGTMALAANRDEHPDRPWDPPDPQAEVEGVRVLHPRDTKGGTWLGTNGRLVAAVTNMAPPGGEGVRSRGLLVRDLLAERGLGAARRRLRDLLDASDYDGFNLLVAAPGEAAVFTWQGNRLQEAELGPGLWLLRHRIHGAAEPADPALRPSDEERRDPENALRALADRALATHGDGPPGCEAACRHGETFATRSATLLFLRPERPETSFFLLAPGPPCRTPFERFPLPPSP